MDDRSQSRDHKDISSWMIMKWIGLFVCLILLAVGGWGGVGKWQALWLINVPLLVAAVAAILMGLILLWLVFSIFEKY